MRTLLLLGWLVLPAGFAVWHYGPGQDRRKLEAIDKLLVKGDKHAADGEWTEAVESYDGALRLLPARQGEARIVRLARAKAQMQAGQLPDAHAALQALCDELKADAGADRALQEEAQPALAQSFYFMTWLMRLEGQPRDVWEPKIDAARQTYRLLAVQAGERSDEKAQVRHEEDLEAAVRLAQMELSKLQKQPLPAPCRCKNSGKQASAGDKKKPVKGQAARDARGASSGPPPDTGGH